MSIYCPLAPGNWTQSGTEVALVSPSVCRLEVRLGCQEAGSSVDERSDALVMRTVRGLRGEGRYGKYERRSTNAEISISHGKARTTKYER